MQRSENAIKSVKDLPTVEVRLTKLEKVVELLQADIRALRTLSSKGVDE